jgi:hemolysin III
VTNGEEFEAPAPPRFRGRLHQAAFFVAVPAGVLLIVLARTAAARTAAALYAATLAGLFGVSGAYHRIRWSPRSRVAMKRADHSMIYVFIAGTTTPVSLLAVRPPWSIVLLCVVWVGAGVGVALKVIRIDGFAVASGLLYGALGWVSIVVAPQLVHRVGVAPFVLIVLGGLLFTAGAVVFWRKWPDPRPAAFGYHEVWHSFVVAAAICHYVAILLIVVPGRPPLG